jgi:hypothetical protein
VDKNSLAFAEAKRGFSKAAHGQKKKKTVAYVTGVYNFHIKRAGIVYTYI